MRKQFQKTLNELYQAFKEDVDAVEAVDYLLSKVNELPEIEAKSNALKEEFPLPNEVRNNDDSFAVFSDGACRGNPGPGSWGVMAQDKTGLVIFESSGVDLPTTNNRMELEGAIQGLVLLKDHLTELGVFNQAKVFLYSDSKYVVDGISKWVESWKKRGWKKADKKVPENIEQWKQLDTINNEYTDLKFLWVKGHTGHPQNEHCDALANLALDESGY
ncbi:MAG: ribonuclease HI [Bacteriovoracaceae bacterium]|jgi:ribonuclease HI|nr:ribonuclease HI [Bacteriovoracaceae bacterium]